MRNRQAAARKKKKIDPFDARYLYNGGTVQSCEEGGTLLQIVESSIHDVGFWLRGSDGSCFDGTSFRSCDPSVGKIVWGWGLVGGNKGKVERFLYHWHDSTSCLGKGKGDGMTMGTCSAKTASWALDSNGRLSTGGMCLVRGLGNEAHLVKCKTGAFEHMAVAPSARQASRSSLL